MGYLLAAERWIKAAVEYGLLINARVIYVAWKSPSDSDYVVSSATTTTSSGGGDESSHVGRKGQRKTRTITKRQSVDTE